MKTTYRVDGMTCGGCSSSLQRLFNQKMPALNASVSHEENTVTLDGDVAIDTVKTIVESAGYAFMGIASS